MVPGKDKALHEGAGLLPCVLVEVIISTLYLQQSQKNGSHRDTAPAPADSHCTGASSPSSSPLVSFPSPFSPENQDGHFPCHTQKSYPGQLSPLEVPFRDKVSPFSFPLCHGTSETCSRDSSPLLSLHCPVPTGISFVL